VTTRTSVKLINTNKHFLRHCWDRIQILFMVVTLKNVNTSPCKKDNEVEVKLWFFQVFCNFFLLVCFMDILDLNNCAFNYQ
jgi:hypothetical protein